MCVDVCWCMRTLAYARVSMCVREYFSLSFFGMCPVVCLCVRVYVSFCFPACYNSVLYWTVCTYSSHAYGLEVLFFSLEYISSHNCAGSLRAYGIYIECMYATLWTAHDMFLLFNELYKKNDNIRHSSKFYRYNAVFSMSFLSNPAAG